MKHVVLEKKDHIAIATVNRPEVLNALNRAVLADLDEMISIVEKDESIYALILTGAGTILCCRRRYQRVGAHDQTAGRRYQPIRKRYFPQTGTAPDSHNCRCERICTGRRLRTLHELRYAHLRR